MIERFVRENVDAQVVRLDLFLKLLEHMFQEAIAHHEPSVSLTLLFASILKVKQAGRAVQLIAEEGFVEEILSIGRTLVEVTVNAAYLQYAGETELGRYLHFHPEAVYQQTGLLRQRKSLGSSSGIVRRIGELVARGGALVGSRTADPNWTSRPLIDRAQLADHASNIPIMALLVERCYPKGHAAVHGTIQSLDTFLTTLTDMGPEQPEDRLNALAEAMFGVNLSLMTLCIYLNNYFHLGMDDSIDLAANADSRSRESLEGA